MSKRGIMQLYRSEDFYLEFESVEDLVKTIKRIKNNIIAIYQTYEGKNVTIYYVVETHLVTMLDNNHAIVVFNIYNKIEDK